MVLEQANKLRAIEIAKNAERENQHSKANMKYNCASLAIKLNPNRPMKEAIADAEELLEWLYGESIVE